VFDTETTGLDPLQGHRLVEVGAVELVNHVPTGKTFHSYINPERDMPEEAFRVHGLSAEFLAGYPLFAEIADELLAFIDGGPLIIHNATFDVRFINAELRRCGRAPLAEDCAVDTLLLAQRRFPGAPASLDALCRRFAVDATARTLHGALLDCQLLAEVYLHLLGGRQADLGLALPGQRREIEIVTTVTVRPARSHAPSEAELEAHAAFIRGIENALWHT
jgi:DNA polymerase-3 subunit epsilon